MIESLNVVLESLLIDVADAKLVYRNFFIFLNESVIRVSKQAANGTNTEIENTKNHLAKLTSNKELLLKLFENKDNFYMSKISAYFNPKLDESLKAKSHSHCLIHDTLTGIIYQKISNTKETKGELRKEAFPLPRSTEFLTEYKPISGIKIIIENVKHLLECICNNPMKVLSQYVTISKPISFSSFGPKVKIWDAVAVYSESVQYHLLLHVLISSITQE